MQFSIKAVIVLHILVCIPLQCAVKYLSMNAVGAADVTYASVYMLC